MRSGSGACCRGDQLRPLDPFAEAFPELRLQRPERQPLSIGRLVDVVAGAGQVLRRREHGPLRRRLVNRDVHDAAEAGARALEERGDDAHRGLHRRTDVAHEGPRQRRRPQQARERLVVDVVRGALDVRSAPAEPADRCADEVWMAGADRLWIHAEPPCGGRPKAVDEHVGARRQRVEHGRRFRDPQVQRHAALVAVEALEVWVPSVRVGPQRSHAVAAVRIFDLDHLRAQVREQQRRVGARQQARQVENANAVKSGHEACCGCIRTRSTAPGRSRARCRSAPRPAGSPYMMNRQPAADSRQTGQTNGTRNGRGRSGSL